MNKMEILKKLREELGSGVVDCQNAIKEANGDYELARDILRKKGLASAQKKASRSACDGLIGFASDNASYALVELNCETDFVAKNDKFLSLLQNALHTTLVAKTNEINSVLSINIDNDASLSDKIIAAIGSIGENITLSRVLYSNVNSTDVIISYIHNATTSTVVKAGKIAIALVFANCTEEIKSLDAFRVLGNQIAMHIAATNPISLNIDSIDKNIIDKERSIYKEQSVASGKPENVIEKMIDGKMKKFFEESVLLEQIFVIDGKTKIVDVINDFNKQNNSNISIKSFTRFAVGELAK